VGGTPARPLTVAHLDAGPTWRGGQQQVFLLMRGLARLGCRPLLIAPDGPLAARVRALGIEVAPWRPRGDLDLPAAFTAASHLRRHAPDLVHAHDARSHAVGWLAARLARVPALVVSRRTAFAAATHPASRLKYALPVDRYLAVSASVRDALRAAHIPDDRIRVIPSGIELDGPPDADSLRRASGLDENILLVGVVASLTREKGQDVAIEALGRLANRHAVHLALIGEGPERDALRARAEQRGALARVHFTGFRADARALLRQLDLCLVPSRIEGLGTAALEAQAEGVAVIASRAGGLPEVVRDGETGRLVPPGDPAALATAIGDALDDPERTRQWVEQAQREVRRHDVDRTVRDTLAVYHEVVGP
jgi:glycosyltransferase involved in cell wall biosynthesis